MPSLGFYSTAKWQALRRTVRLRDRHICQMCQAYCPARNAGAVDHKIPRRVRPDLAYELSNLWWLCTTCHNSTKRTQENNAHKPLIGTDGLNEEWRG